MKIKKMLSVLLLGAMLLSVLSSCGAAGEREQGALSLENYPTDAVAQSLAASSGLGDVRVMSFNLQVTLSTNATNATNRKNAVAQEILSYMPDLLGLQEDGKVWNDFLSAQLRNSQSQAYVPITTTKSLGDGTERCAIYYNPQTLTLISGGSFELSTPESEGGNGRNALKWNQVTPEIQSALSMVAQYQMYSGYKVPYDSDGDGIKESWEWDTILDQRRMTYGIFQTDSGKRFLYVNTHLQHRSQTGALATHIPEFLQLREMERMAEWDILQANIASLLVGDNADLPVIITGDMNETLGSSSYHYFLGTGKYTDNVKYLNSSKEALIRRDQDGTMNSGFGLDSKDDSDWDGDKNKDEWYSFKNGVISSNLSHGDKTSSTTLDYCFISPNKFVVEQYQVGDGRVQMSGDTYTITRETIYVKASEGTDAAHKDSSGNLLDDDGKKIVDSREIHEPAKSTITNGYVYTSDHLPVIVDLTIGNPDANSPMTLERPGFEKNTSTISYYSGTANTSWYPGDPAEGQTATYVLDTADKLMGFVALRAKGKKINQVWIPTYTFKGVTIKLGANMVINRGSVDEILAASTKHKWSEFNSANVFYGVFDGDGHYISGAYMEATSGAKGFFGTVGGEAEIKNLALVNSYMRTASNSEKNRLGAISPLIAANSSVTFYNLYTDVVVKEHPSYAFSIVGGLVGQITTSNTTVVFDHCTVAGSMKIQGNYVGGLVGSINSSTANVSVTNCVNTATISGKNYTGGLIGYAKAASLTVYNSANLGNVTGLRMSGGLIGTISSCADFTVTNCVVNADLDFSGISQMDEDETKDGVQVADGCQVGGLIGRTYNVSGFVSNCALYGSLKATDEIETTLDRCFYYQCNADGTPKTDGQGNKLLDTNYVGDFNHLAAGGIFGFNSYYTTSWESSKKSYIHVDHIVVSMDMEGVDSYLGGARNIAINDSNSRISYRTIVYDSNKIGDLPVWGMRIDKDRDLIHDNEKNSQISSFRPYSSVNFLYTDVDFDTMTGNYASDVFSFTLWEEMTNSYIVPNKKVESLIEKAVGTLCLDVVGYQTRTTEGYEETKTDYRFVTVIRNADQPAYGFEVRISYMDGNNRVVRDEIVYCPTVYSKIIGGGETYKASDFSGQYLATLVIKGVPNSVENILVEVTPISARKTGDVVTNNEDYLARVFVLNQN